MHAWTESSDLSRSGTETHIWGLASQGIKFLQGKMGNLSISDSIKIQNPHKHYLSCHSCHTSSRSRYLERNMKIWRMQYGNFNTIIVCYIYPWNQALTCFHFIANGITWPATRQAVCTSPVWERGRERGGREIDIEKWILYHIQPWPQKRIICTVKLKN